jgi:hypothetical protein
MPHLLIEIARDVIERQMLSVPIELDPNGAPADILAPPLSIRSSLPTPFGTMRVQLIVRTVTLRPITGSAQTMIAMKFDESSIEALSFGASVGLLGGNMSASAALAVRQGIAPDGRPIAQLGVDLSASTVTFQLDAPSRGRLATAIGGALVTPIENAVAAMLTTRFRRVGFQAAGLTLGLTPSVPSEDLLTVEALPGVVWVDPRTLALALSYAPEPPPPPFQPVPFLPGGPTAFGMRLSNDGFQRTVRNPAVRKLARDMLTERRIDDFVHDAFVARGGGGDVTDADRVEGAKRLDGYLATPAGQAELANETPSPVGGGALRKRIRDVPDPFSDFDVEVPELDLWLGEGRVEGRAIARGSVNGFGFTAHLSFRATPALLQGASPSIELHQLEIDPPDIEISLPFWLELAAGILAGAIAGSLAGALVGFLLSAVVSALAEALIPPNLGSKVPPPKGKPLGKLPTGITIQRLDVTPQFLAFTGSWFVFIDDPRPFYPRATLVDTVDRTRVGSPSEGRAAFVCLAALGVVMTAREGTGTSFGYVRQAWRSSVTATLQTDGIPLPVTRFPWRMAVGYLDQRHYPVMPDPAVVLAPGPLPVTATVWLPEPPFLGRTERRSFTIGVRAAGEDSFVFDVPPDAGSVLLELSARIVDAAGVAWELLHYVDVPNETVAFGADFQEFAAQCAKQRREFHVGTVPSLLDQLWNPPNVLVEQVYEAIRTEQPAVTREIDRVFAADGVRGLQLLLAPSLAGQGP